MFKLYLEWFTDLYDLTQVVGNISLRSNIDEISEEITFEIAKLDYLEEGNIIRLYKDDRMVFKGMIIKRTKNNEYTETIVANDYGWILNKNEDIYQFNCTVSQAIEKICKDYEIPIGGIVDIPTPIKDIKKGNLSDIIKELLELAKKEQGIRYIWEMWEGKFWVERIKDTPVIYRSDLFDLTNEQINNFMQSPTIETSIEDMKNSVKIIKEADKTYTVLATATDPDNISRYGWLQKLETVDKDNESKASSIAKNLLSELNKVSKKVTVTLPGNIDCKASKLFKFDDNFIKDDRYFLVVSCTHNIKGAYHLMDVDMEVL